MARNRNPFRVGQEFSHTYKNTLYTIRFMGDDAQPWACSNGYNYSSLSAAGCDITGKKTIDGPAFWGVKPTGKKAKAAKAAQRKAAKRVDNTGKAIKAAAPAPPAKPAPTASETRAARIAALRDELAALLEAEAKDVLAGLDLVKQLGRRTGT